MKRLSFMDPPVLSIMADEKTVTRRMTAPRLAPGDVVGVCEALVPGDAPDWLGPSIRYRADGRLVRDADGVSAMDWPWKVRVLPARYCPTWAVRTRLEILDVRPEFLTAITDEDARAEGIDRLFPDDAAVCRAAKSMGACIDDPRASFVVAFRELHNLADDADPTVFRIAFRRLPESPQ